MLRENIPGPLKGFLDKLVGWARSYSLWPVHLVTGCCSPEFMQVAGPRYDMERYGILPMPSARYCDVLMIVGVLSRKMAKRVKMIYEQMPEPKFVMSVGVCPTNKGPFYDSYAVVRADEIVPVDVYVPGCPPRPEAIIHGFMVLREKVKKMGL